MKLVETIQLKKTKELSLLCHRCKNLYNTGLFYIKHFGKVMRDASHLESLPKDVQYYIKKAFKRKTEQWKERFREWRAGKRKRVPSLPSWYLNWYDTKWLLKDIKEYKCLPSQVSQNVLKNLHISWKTFITSLKDWKESPEKYEERPNPPYFLKKNGEYIACFNHQHIPQKKQLERKRLQKKLYFPKKTHLDPVEVVTPIDTLQQVRIVPKNDIYNLELVYNHINQYDLNLDKKKIIAIDIGVNNLACVVNNIGLQPFSINGRPLKSVNQYYNKLISKKQSVLSNQLLSKSKKEYTSKIYKKNGKFTKNFIKFNNKQARIQLQQTNSMKRLRRIRNNKIKDYMHKASRYIVNWCIEHHIGTIVIGKNPKWKREVNLGKRVNQSFVQIPFNMLIEKLQYKAEISGINLKLITEEYTSQTCFKCGIRDKKNRKYRGLYMCSHCKTKINADVNGAYNIMKKAFSNALSVEGIEGTQLYPILINLDTKSNYEV